jgi:hypothetical protein
MIQWTNKKSISTVAFVWTGGTMMVYSPDPIKCVCFDGDITIKVDIVDQETSC